MKRANFQHVQQPIQVSLHKTLRKRELALNETNKQREIQFSKNERSMLETVLSDDRGSAR